MYTPTTHRFTVILTGARSGRVSSARQIMRAALARAEDVVLLADPGTLVSQYQDLLPYIETASTLEDTVLMLRRLGGRSSSRPCTLIIEDCHGILDAPVLGSTRSVTQIGAERGRLIAEGQRHLRRVLDRDLASLVAIPSRPERLDLRLVAEADGVLDHAPAGGHLAVAA